MKVGHNKKEKDSPLRLAHCEYKNKNQALGLELKGGAERILVVKVIIRFSVK